MLTDDTTMNDGQAATERPVARSRRAEPLPPDERRRKIAEAVAPLLIERGAAVTTKELAERAGVAEGTLFSVFPDKRSLIEGAIAVHMDPAPLEADIAGIDRDRDLVSQVAAAMHLISDRTDEVVALVVVLHTLVGHEPKPADSGARSSMLNWSETIRSAVTELLSEHPDELRIPPDRVAAALLGLVVAARRPFAGRRDILSVDEIVDVVLFGALKGAKGSASCH